MKSFIYIMFALCSISFSLLTACDKKPSVYTLKNSKLTQDSTAFGSPKPLISEPTSDNDYQSCVVQTMEWTPGSAESILLEPTGWIFPGNILDAKTLQDGEYKTLAGNRENINLIIDGQMFNKMSIQVPNPGQKSISDSITSMLESGSMGSTPADVSITANEVYSEDHLKLLVRSKYSLGFTKLAAGFDFQNSNISSRYLLDVTQVYYTINVETPPNRFFTSQPQELPEKSFAPVYISSVKYGRRVMIAIENHATSQKMEADFKAKFKAFASNSELDVYSFLNKNFSDISIKILAKGGNADNPYKLFKAVSKKEELFDILARDSQWSLDHLGKPLAYEVRNTTDKSVFYLSQTGKYKARICTIKSQNDSTMSIAPIERLCAWHVGGEDRNFGSDPTIKFSIKLEPNKNKILCTVKSYMVETSGDGTAGSIIFSKNIIELPEDYTVTQISSPTDIIQPEIVLTHKGLNPFPYDDSKIYPVSMVALVGDSDGNNNDDLFPGACGDDTHAQIRSILFNPITFQYTRKIKK